MKIEPALSRKLDRIGDGFLATALRDEVDYRDNLPALFELGAVLSRLGRHREGAEVDRRLVLLEPNEPILRYNLACSLAILGRTEESIDALGKAIELGYRDVDHLIRDRDLRTLRGDARFESMVQRLRDGAVPDSTPAPKAPEKKRSLDPDADPTA